MQFCKKTTYVISAYPRSIGGKDTFLSVAKFDMYDLRFLTAVSMEMAVFWVVAMSNHPDDGGSTEALVN
jgi:hypothetical protein